MESYGGAKFLGLTLSTKSKYLQICICVIIPTVNLDINGGRFLVILGRFGHVK